VRLASSHKTSLIEENKMSNTWIPSFYDHQLINSGCKHAEGSVEIESENITSALQAAKDISDDHILISYTENTPKGYMRGIAVIPFENLEMGKSITLPNRQKLILLPDNLTDEQMQLLKLFETFS
jgi:hypothetical protein